MQQIPLQDLAPLIISVASTLTSFIALATAIFKLKAERAKDPPQPLLIINQEIVVLADYATPQELAAYLEETLQP